MWMKRRARPSCERRNPSVTRSKLRRGTTQAAKTILLLARTDDALRESEIFASSGIEGSIHRAAQPILEQHGFTVRLQRTRMDPHEAELYAGDSSVNGLIFMGGIVNRELIVALQRVGLPFVVVGAHVHPLQVNCVIADYLDGMARTVEHLLCDRSPPHRPRQRPVHHHQQRGKGEGLPPGPGASRDLGRTRIASIAAISKPAQVTP